MSLLFEPMHSIVPEGRIGVAAVQHFDVSKRDSMLTALRPGEYVAEGRYARLRVHGAVMMSDTRMEHVTNYEVVRMARGNVLIAGLGLGMILLPILRQDRVKAVTVVEKYQDVIALIELHIRQRLKHLEAAKLIVINADIYEWIPKKKGRQFDAIYFDIWSDISTDDLADMTHLRRKFAPYLNVGGWASCWKQGELRARRRGGW